jgi:hypothetical protein
MYKILNVQASLFKSVAREIQFRKAKKLSRTDAAYIAGLMDADGCIQTGTKSPFYVRAKVTNNCLPVLHWLQQVTGVGQIVIIRNRAKPTHRMTYDWLVNSIGATEVLRQVVPFLKIKRGNAEAAIILQRMVKHKGRNWTDPVTDVEREERRKLAAIINDRTYGTVLN